jgi:hypothetical protein
MQVVYKVTPNNMLELVIRIDLEPGDWALHLPG